MPRVARPSRLSVGSPLIRNRQPAARRLVRDARAVAAALFADDEQQADARSRPRAAAARPPRPARRECPSRRTSRGRRAGRPRRGSGKNGGTQSKCVEKTTRRPASRRRVAMTLKRVSSTRCSSTAQPAPAQVVREPARRPRPRGPSSSRCRRARASARRCLPDPRFELRARVGARVAVLDDDRRREREAPLGALARRSPRARPARRRRLRERRAGDRRSA